MIIVFSIVAICACIIIAVLLVRKQVNLCTVEQFMSEEECQYFINLASAYLEAHYQEAPKVKARTSTPIYLDSTNEMVQRIRQRAAKMANVPEANLEVLQVVRYTLTQEYLIHFDWFTDQYVGKFGSGPGKTKPHYQRQSTILVYLNNVARGGETHFPYLRKKISPMVGTAVCWNNLWPNGKGNKLTAHAALPVTKGIKWAVNIWVADKDLSRPSGEPDTSIST